LTENQQNNNAKPDNVNVDQVLADNKTLKTQLLTAKKVIEEYKKSATEQKTLNDKLGQRVASVDFERRKDKNQNILQGAYKEDELNARVESLAKSTIPFEEIQSIVGPLAEMRKATVEQAKAVEINQKAEELAKTKSASIKQVSQSTPKVAIKNAAATEEEKPEVPAWAIVSGGIA